jgi:hypothetical protein
MSNRGRLVVRAAKQDPADAKYALLESHRERAAARLTAETEALLGEGARVEDIVWILTPDGASAMLASDLIEGLASRGAKELAHAVVAAQGGLEAGHCICAYMGPEGQLFEWLRIDAAESPTLHDSSAEPEEANSEAEADFDATTRCVGAALRILLSEHRFALPLHAAVIGQKGGMVYFRFVATEEPGGIDVQPLAHYDAGPCLGSPLQMLFTDARGAAARAVARKDEGEEESVAVTVLS